MIKVRLITKRWFLAINFFVAFAVIAAPQYQFNILHTKGGLPSSFVNKVFQQASGYIWIATDRGVSRYDGGHFNHYYYAPGQNNHISNNYVVDIFEDNNHNIWLATEDGLNKISADGKVTHFLAGQDNSLGLDSSWFTSVFESKDGTLWLGSGREGLFAYSTKSKKFTKYQHESGELVSVEVITQAENGDIYVGTSLGLAKVDRNNQLLINVKNNQAFENEPFLHDLFWLDKDRLWVATELSGVILYNTKLGVVEEQFNMNSALKLLENSVYTIERVSKDAIWFGHKNKGISVFDTRTQDIHYIQSHEFDNSALPSGSIIDIFRDHSGLIWVATEDGLAIYSPIQGAAKTFNKKYDGSGLSSNIIFDVFHEHDTKTWLATSKGINLIDLATENITHFPIKLSEAELLDDQEVWNIAKLSQDRLWLATGNGLLLFNTQSGFSEKLPIDQHPFQSDLYTLMPAAEGGLWVTGYQNVGLQLIKPDADTDNVLKSYLTENESSYYAGGNFTMSKLMSKAGELWLGTTDDIYRINPKTNKTYHYKLSENLGSIRATGIVEGRNNVFWATTQGAGLVKLSVDKNNQVTTKSFNINKGYPTNEYKAVIIIDDDLWLTSINGLHKFNPQTELMTSYPTLFHNSELVFTENSITQQGSQLLLGSNQGLLVVNLNKLTRNYFQPPVVITCITAEGVLVDPNNNSINNSIELPYEQNDIEFHYASLDYTKPQNNRYRYKLEGFDDEWSEPTADSKVTFNNLRPGEYSFRVRGTNSDGQWAEQSAEFYFTVNYPWWFYALVIASLMVLITTIFVFVGRRQHLKNLEIRAHHDSLTGLENRYSFNKKLDKTLSTSHQSFALVLIDLDDFKEVNDNFGHAVGDAYLQQVSLVILSCIRPTDFIARLGGDEFALMILGDMPSDIISRIAERIRVKLCKPIFAAEHRIVASVSLGIAMCPSDARTSSTLLSKADAAMHAAKENGKNNICFYNEQLGIEINRKLKLRNYLKKAIEYNEFELYYQPKVNQISGDIVGAEALLRWLHPEDGFISPAIFIPEAERNGTIIEIGFWVIEQACYQVVAWDNDCADDFRVSINLSPLQMMNEGFLNGLEAVLRKTGAKPSSLEFEITETVLIENKVKCQELISQLKALDISIALDDFGSGFSSLSYLTEYSIDTLKIDRSLVLNIEHNEKNRIVLKNVYALAEELGLSVVAEGVETKAQLQRLKCLNGQIIQGFYFYPALKAKEFTLLLQDKLETVEIL